MFFSLISYLKQEWSADIPGLWKEHVKKEIIGSARFLSWAYPDQPVYYSFDVKKIGKYVKLPDLEQLETIPPDIKTNLEEILQKIAHALQIKFIEISTIKQVSRNNNILLLGFNPTFHSLAHGKAGDAFTQNDKPETGALLKLISLSDEMKNAPDYFLERVFTHEVFHTLGLTHPSAGSLIDTSDTVMHVDNSNPCLSRVPSTIPASCFEREVPAVAFTEIDIAAAKEVIERNKRKSSTQIPTSSYQNSFFNKAVTHVGYQVFSSAVTIYLKTLVQGYLKPYCIQNQYCSSRQADHLGSLINIAIDTIFRSMPEVIAGQLLSILLKYIVRLVQPLFKDINPNLTEAHCQAVSSVLATLFGDKTLTTIMSMPFQIGATALAYNVAWQTIRSMPKLTDEDRVNAYSP